MAPTRVRMRSSGWIFASQAAKTALSVPTGILLARVLGADGKGVVTVVQTTSALSVAILNLGMPSAVMWLAAKGRSTGGGALKLGAIFAAGAVTLLGAAAWVAGPGVVAQGLGLTSALLIALALAAVTPSMVGYFVDSHLIGRGAIRIISLADIVVLSVQLGAMATLAVIGWLTPVAAVMVWLTVITGATLWKAGRALRSDGGAHGSAKTLWVEGRVFAFKSWLANTVNMMSLRQDMLLLAAFAGVRAVGIYSIAVSAAELAWYVPNALQSVATVKFSAEGDGTDLVERMNRSIWPFTLVLGLAVFAVAAPLIPLVYGEAFRASVLPLAMLLPGVVATSMSISLSAWLTGQGHPQEPALANGVNMVVNLLANVVLAPRMGAVGAALSSSISYSVGSAVIVWRFHRRTGTPVTDVLVPRLADLKTILLAVIAAVSERLTRRRPL